MRNFLIIFSCLLISNLYSQSKDTIYFLINKKDTLIKKQVATKINNYEGYRIIDEKKLVTDIKRSSDIGGDDVEYEAFEKYSFSFNRKNDIIISQTHLKSLNFIKNRRQFIDTIKYLNKTRASFVFIEPIKCDKFVLRKVSLLTFE